MNNYKKIGLFGFGTVGKGFYDALKRQPHLPVKIEKVCVRRLDLPRIGHELYFTDNPNEILEDPEIDIVIELIDDAAAAKVFVKKALIAGKHVISANKKMVGESLFEIDQWQSNYNSSFLYDAAVGGSIPIIYDINHNFHYHQVTKIRGILNGSSNYILTQMIRKGWTFKTALSDAQKLGFAEANPTLDVDGVDASYKLAILAYHAFGEVVSMKSCEIESIRNVTERDIKEAIDSGMKIKPIATIELKNGTYHCSVKPELVDKDDELFNVDFENNAIGIYTSLSGTHLSIGKGAGALPTGSAVISDLKKILQGYKYQKSLRELAI